MKLFIIFLAAWAVSSALVPREKRAQIEEEVQPAKVASSSEAPKAPVICAEDTPCAWSMYPPATHITGPNVYVENTYCKCGEGTSCEITRDAKNINAYILHCITPEEAETSTETGTEAGTETER